MGWPAELTGYSVALASDRDAAGEVVWRGGGSLAPELSLPRLAARWGNGESAAAASRPGARPITRLSAEERQQAWREARLAADNAAQELRRLGGEDPAAAGDMARSAADLLHVAARAGEPNGKGPLHDAARVYDRASRNPYGRPARRSSGGADLRLAATTLALVARANRDDAAALMTLVVALAGLVDAVAELRATQARSAQAAAARIAAEQLRAVTRGYSQGSSVRPVTTGRNPARSANGTSTRRAHLGPLPRPAVSGDRIIALHHLVACGRSVQVLARRCHSLAMVWPGDMLAYYASFGFTPVGPGSPMPWSETVTVMARHPQDRGPTA